MTKPEDHVFGLIDQSRKSAAAHRIKLQNAEAEREALWRQEILVRTNSGTYSAQEAVRAVGSSAPEHAEYRVYERVGDGRQRTEGCNPHRAPGTTRYLNSSTLGAARKRLAALS